MRTKFGSPEHRKLLSDKKKGVPKTEEHKANISKAMVGVPKSDSHKKAMSEAQLNRKEK